MLRYNSIRSSSFIYNVIENIRKLIYRFIMYRICYTIFMEVTHS